MIGTLLLFATVGAPAQAEARLTISDITPLHGQFGPVREDKRISVGDVAYSEWTLKGLRADAAGKVVYSTKVEISNGKGEMVYTQEPRRSVHQLTLGGSSVKGIHSSAVGLNTPLGRYTTKVTVKDEASGATASFQRDIEIVKPDLSIVRLYLSYDERGEIHAPARGVTGQTLWLNYMVQGFERDKDGNPKLKTTLRILEKGKPVLDSPMSGEVTTAPEAEKLVPVSAGLNLNREGDFRVEIKVTDAVDSETATLTIPLSVTGISK